MDMSAIDLGDVLTIVEVADLKGRLLAALDAGKGLTLEAGALTLVDTAGVQLLAALFLEAGKRGVPVEWGEVSDALRRAVSLAGLRDHVHIPVV